MARLIGALPRRITNAAPIHESKRKHLGNQVAKVGRVDRVVLPLVALQCQYTVRIVEQRNEAAVNDRRRQKGDAERAVGRGLERLVGRGKEKEHKPDDECNDGGERGNRGEATVLACQQNNKIMSVQK